MPPGASRSALRARQLARLQKLFGELGGNRFYQKLLLRAPLTSLEEFRTFPFTTKDALALDQRAEPPYGTNLSFPLEAYTRFHQTSGTTGHPLRWLDTPESWDWMIGNWLEVFRAARVTAEDRILFAFSFGPFIGFWLAFEAGTRLGALCLPGGGLSSAARLRLLLDNKVTVLCCTPTYALRLAEVAAGEGIELSSARVRTLIVAGEPGGSIPATRAKLTHLWGGARVFDHHGMTEVGPVTYECPARPGCLHVLEESYLAEVIDPQTGVEVEPGVAGELVLTTLGRAGSPLLRYRTGDLVRTSPGEEACCCGRLEMVLEGGILGRTDDMVVVRGVNVYPAAVEELVRSIPGIAEYRVFVTDSESLAQLRMEIEPAPGTGDPRQLVRELENAFTENLALRVPVHLVEAGHLPRFEMKAKRWIRTSKQ